MNEKHTLLNKIEDRSAVVGVIGLGYTGLPLVVEFARAGFCTVGVDLDDDRCRRINEGESYIGDVPTEALADVVGRGLLCATSDYGALAGADAVIICVPTPLGKAKDPDISYIVSATDCLEARVHDGMLVVLESTTYPGTTEEIVAPRLARNGRVVGTDLFVAYSPERVDPGNATFHTRNTPKVVAGMTPDCLEVAQALYATVVDTVVPVSSPAAAEMTKILENTFRAVNIGLANEFAIICERLGISVWEVIHAAATKPFGFMPFYPGPGLGGHCIPIDPLYLTWKMRSLGQQTRFIELADTVNSNMPHYVVSRIADALNDEGKPIRGQRILVLGVAYKGDVADLRESPALEIIDSLLKRGALVQYSDPYIPRLRLLSGEIMESVELTAPVLDWADCVLVHTAHRCFDWEFVASHAHLAFDTRNVLPELDGGNCRVVRL